MTDKLRGVMKRCGFEGGGIVIMAFLFCVKTLKRIPIKDKATVPAIAAILATLLQRKPLTENIANSLVANQRSVSLQRTPRMVTTAKRATSPFEDCRRC